MKKMNKLSISLLSAILSAGYITGSALPAVASPEYTPVAGTFTEFDKYLVMDEQANVPNVNFEYTVSNGESQTYDIDGKKFEVLSGASADGTPVITGTSEGVISFEPYDTTTLFEDKAEGDLVKDIEEGEKYAKKTARVDFSDVTFSEPGVYRYIITESGTNQGVTNDTDPTRTLDVYVTDNEGKLEVSAYVLHSDVSDIIINEDYGTDGNVKDNKSQGFTNEYDTSDLTVRKEVSGNQASRDKYFEFTVAISDAVPGTVYDVILKDCDAQTGVNDATVSENENKINPGKLTVGKDGTVTQKFYLNHGQQIEIQGIAKDTSYKVTENPEDYKQTANTADEAVISIQDGTVSADTSGEITSADITTGYLNTRDGIIPTGIFMSAVPFAAAVLIGGIGIATIVLKKRKGTINDKLS